MRWHFVAKEGMPKEKGFYKIAYLNTIARDGFVFMADRKFYKQSWSKKQYNKEIIAWISHKEMREELEKELINNENQ